MTSTSCKPELFLDIETFSSVDIRSAGLYPYVESDDFEVLLIAYDGTYFVYYSTKCGTTSKGTSNQNYGNFYFRGHFCI